MNPATIPKWLHGTPRHVDLMHYAQKGESVNWCAKTTCSEDEPNVRRLYRTVVYWHDLSQSIKLLTGYGRFIAEDHPQPFWWGEHQQLPLVVWERLLGCSMLDLMSVTHNSDTLLDMHRNTPDSLDACLKVLAWWLQSNDVERACSSMHVAIYYGQYTLLPYLHARGFSMRYSTDITKKDQFRLNMNGNYAPNTPVTIESRNLMVVATVFGHMNCMQFLISNDAYRRSLQDMQPSIWLEVPAASMHYVRCLDLLRNHVSEPTRRRIYEIQRQKTEGVLKIAAAENDLATIVELETMMPCDTLPWTEAAAAEAARHGNLDVLVYMLAHKCPWDEHVPMQSARAGHLHVLTFAHEKQCPWSEKVIDEAARGGSIPCVQLCLDRGDAMTSNTRLSAMSSRQLGMLQFLQARGCPELVDDFLCR